MMWSYFLAFGAGLIIGGCGMLAFILTLMKKAMGLMKPKMPSPPMRPD